MMMLMESRGETVTFVALRAMVNHLPAQQIQNATRPGVMKEINFLEWCCVHFGQSWEAMAERGAGAGAETPFTLTDAMKADIAASKVLSRNSYRTFITVTFLANPADNLT